jgi:hypothetical protein
LGHFYLGGDVRELITSNPHFFVYVVVPNSLDFIVGCFKCRVGNDDEVRLGARFNFCNIGSFFVQQVRRNIEWYHGANDGTTLLQRLFFHDS